MEAHPDVVGCCPGHCTTGCGCSLAYFGVCCKASVGSGASCCKAGKGGCCACLYSSKGCRSRRVGSGTSGGSCGQGCGSWLGPVILERRQGSTGGNTTRLRSCSCISARRHSPTGSCCLLSAARSCSTWNSLRQARIKRGSTSCLLGSQGCVARSGSGGPRDVGRQSSARAGCGSSSPRLAGLRPGVCPIGLGHRTGEPAPPAAESSAAVAITHPAGLFSVETVRHQSSSGFCEFLGALRATTCTIPYHTVVLSQALERPGRHRDGHLPVLTSTLT